MRRSRRACLLATVLLAALPLRAWALGQTRYVETAASAGSVPLVQGKTTASLLVDAADWAGVVRAARDLQADIARVTGLTPQLLTSGVASARSVVIIGTVGRSPLIDRLVQERKIDV